LDRYETNHRVDQGIFHFFYRCWTTSQMSHSKNRIGFC